ncbi:MAG TPA: tetraacyldisaccharide 4'-kinase [Epsilonproteobacteria bacterium]|nr:tetraacyldisaccharide 4'-kinase [Campylobacterota bacterium]HHD78301.1 tetraacyldisaccharide 4'-kinase [Campylobacterota bacterium]
MKAFFEQMFFTPKWYHYPIIVVLLPFSFMYGFGMWLRRKYAKQISFGVPIISVGNLIVGGSGKTPFVIALASRFKDVTVISRGYGRQSRGLIEVSKQGSLLVDVAQSGDEPMLMARALPNASVIVSEDRKSAIALAIKYGAKVIVLDDGFNRVDLEKFDILLEPLEIENYYTFPSGPFREFMSTRRHADIIAKEGKAFTRLVTIENTSDKMVLVTAISNPKRLDAYLPKNVVQKIYYDDHAYFNEAVLEKILEENQATSILCTSKDKVKMQDFKLPISEMKLKLEIKNEIWTQVDAYVEGYRNA